MWYVELHGNSDPRTGSRIEVASKGVTALEAAELKRQYPEHLAAARRDSPSFPALELWVEPADRIVFAASCAKTNGILGRQEIGRAVHFELPRSARVPAHLDASAGLAAAILRGLPGLR